MKPKNYTKKDFLREVTKEATILKSLLTEKEKNKLNYKTFDPLGPRTCIYGQIAGHCRNSRARNLISRCCQRVIDFNQINTDTDHFKEEDNRTYSNYVPFINGSYEELKKHDPVKDWSSFFYRYLSALESYIQFKDAKKKMVIDFLKDKRSTLNL